MGDDKSRVAPVQLRAEWQFPLGKGGDPPSCELWDNFVPQGDGAGSEAERLGGQAGAAFLWVEVRQNVLFEHAGSYIMLKDDMEYATEVVAYANAMQPQQTMGERIRQLRLARGWSQTQLAERVGVTGGAISHWESGLTKNIKLGTFLKLCDELGTVPHYLIFGPGKQPSQGRRQA